MAGVPQSDFLKLFLKHESALKAYLRSLLHNMDAVEDVLQSASVVMWQKMDQLRDASGFLPWAKVIVRYESLAYRRNHARDHLVFDDQLIDGKKARGAHYLNGQLIGEYDIVQPRSATLGQAAISNWTRGDHDRLRTLNGRVDFFAYFARVLSAEEIQLIYENGRNE